MIKLSILRWESYLGLSVWAQGIHKDPFKGKWRQEYERSYGNRGCSPEIAGFEDERGLGAKEAGKGRNRFSPRGSGRNQRF